MSPRAVRFAAIALEPSRSHHRVKVDGGNRSPVGDATQTRRFMPSILDSAMSRAVLNFEDDGSGFEGLYYAT